MYCKSRKSAIEKGRQFYKTGLPCSRGHISKRYTNTRRCYECAKINALDRYNAVKLQTPFWADSEAIQNVYSKSSAMGSDFEVDHVIPLRGDLVSGLHVHYNLQIIPKSENLSKKNKFCVDKMKMYGVVST